MKKTQLIVFERSNNGGILDNTIINTTNLQQENGATYSGFGYLLQGRSQTNIIRKGDPYVYDPQAQGIEIDLYDDVSIPITYNIIDVREPEKRKTSWSKTILVPGTKNNNRVFSHIYDIGGDQWVKIRGRAVWSGFNPNLKTEVVILNDGIQVLKGNMQLKQATKDVDGNIEYEIALNGDLTSLFFDVGNKKLSDLDFDEWSHSWSRENVTRTWSGYSKKSDGTDFQHYTISSTKSITDVFKHETTGRLAFTTTTAHGFSVGDFILIVGNVDGSLDKFKTIFGQWVVTDIISSTKFAVNNFYPKALSGQSWTLTGNGWTAAKTSATGRGYVYPMIAWGTEYDFNSFPVTSFVPGFFIKEVWDKVFAETNSSYVSNFIDSQFFKRLILVQRKGSYDLSPADLQSRKFWVGTTQSFYTLASSNIVQPNYYNYLQYSTGGSQSETLVGSLNPNRTQFRAESGGVGTQSFYDNFDNWSQDNNSWTVQKTGEYQLSTSFKISVWCDMNGYNTEIFPDGTASFSPTNPYFKYYPGSWPPNANPNGNNGIVVRARLRRKRNGQITPDLAVWEYPIWMNRESYYTTSNDRSASSSGNWAYFGRYQPASWENIQVNLTSTTTYFAEGDEVWVEISTYINAGQADPSILPIRAMALSFYETYYVPNTPDPPEYKAIRGEWSIRLESGAYIFTDPSTKASENTYIEGSSFLPNEMTCKDFLLSIIKMFNLHIEPDKQIERKYYIEPRDDFYYTGSGGENDYADWSDKIDNANIEILPVGELIAKNYIFANKEENDYWNKRFKDDRGRPYSYYNKTIINDFLTNEAKIEIAMGTTVMVNNPEGSDVVMPAIYQKESTGAAKPVTNSLPRILIWGGIKPYTAQRGGSSIQLANPSVQNGTGWEIISSIATTTGSSSSNYNWYPYAGTVDSPCDPYYDINWYNMEQGDFVYWDTARWSNDNLYNKYWSNFINEISDPSSKVIRCQVRLTPKDIYDLDFRRIYIIDNNYLRLQKVIDYDPVSDGLTTCEFLKLKSVTKYIKKSIVVDDFGDAATEFSPEVLPVIGNNPFVRDYAPIRKRPDFVFNNTAPSVSGSNNQTITLSGLSNFVAPSAKNIKINGNENAVGDGTNNIHISSGNGNFVTGGVNNVNVIGTNKKYINESDVTYINGIRYKNGTPISRASVLDAGQDVAMVRQSLNTTANVVDASEDVVISAGSTSFENVMNAGVDRILPDLPDLGLGTNINPNPRTNFIGAYVETSATASITARVREARFFKQ